MIRFREKRLSSKGFSLIELMIVVAIIGILGAVGIPAYLGVQKKAKRSEFKTNLEILRLLEEKRYAEKGSYEHEEGFDGSDTEDLMGQFSEFRPGVPEDLLYTYDVAVTDGGQGFTARATGNSKGPDPGLEFKVDQDNNRTGW